ncbi:MAG: Rap1a/Tai family immunity protein [Woeseiaceae bacterium]|nr:Rap1a/Tai family immunity protein [Woeseiaceae bacterium]
MEIIRKLALGAVFALAAVTGLAQEKTDQTKEISRLLDGCRVVMSADALTTVHRTNYKMGYCAGYLHASYTQHRAWKQLSKAPDSSMCLPDRFHLPDFARVVVEYADANPDHVNETLFALIYRAFVQGYPCTQTNG